MYRIFLLILVSHLAISQELIVNGNFENYLRCPKVFSTDSSQRVFIGWKSYDAGTPDYYNKCGERDVKVPYLWAGKQYPSSGNGFAGIYVWGKSAYREYLLAELREPTTPGLEYNITINYALAKNSPYACDWLGIRLLDSEGRTLQTIMEYDVVQTDPHSGWVTASFTHIGMGTEHALVIGNFYVANDFDVIEVPRTYVHPMLESRSYYFIDDVSFLRSDEINIFTDINEGEPIELAEVYFAFNESVLLLSSYKQLNQLVSYMHENEEVRIEIIGHTDNIGSEVYNQKLSELRANSIMKYLMEKGIDSARLKAIGRGYSEPVSTNNTSTGRDTNRRVTFTILLN